MARLKVPRRRCKHVIRCSAEGIRIKASPIPAPAKPLATSRPALLSPVLKNLAAEVMEASTAPQRGVGHVADHVALCESAGKLEKQEKYFPTCRVEELQGVLRSDGREAKGFSILHGTDTPPSVPKDQPIFKQEPRLRTIHPASSPDVDDSDFLHVDDSYAGGWLVVVDMEHDDVEAMSTVRRVLVESSPDHKKKTGHDVIANGVSVSTPLPPSKILGALLHADLANTGTESDATSEAQIRPDLCEIRRLQKDAAGQVSVVEESQEAHAPNQAGHQAASLSPVSSDVGSPSTSTSSSCPDLAVLLLARASKSAHVPAAPDHGRPTVFDHDSWGVEVLHDFFTPAATHELAGCRLVDQVRVDGLSEADAESSSRWITIGVCADPAMSTSAAGDAAKLRATNRCGSVAYGQATKQQQQPDAGPSQIRKKKVHYNYELGEVKGDGQCLFRAVACQHALAKGEPAPDPDLEDTLATFYRASALVQLLSQSESMASLVEGSDVVEYVKRMADPYEWAGEVELYLLSEMFQIPIVVYTDYFEPRSTGWPGVAALTEYGHHFRIPGQKPIRIFYDGRCHYQKLQLHDSDDEDTEIHI